jgi:hypothetical protein
MEIGRSALPGRRWVAFALAALLALTLVVTAGSAGAAGAGHAVAAKKKCKFKKFKNTAATAKKKKCKKRRGPVPPVPPVLPAPAPLVRGTITWSANVDVDLHAYDASGNHSGWVGPPPGGIVEGIPNATHSPDLGTAGTETFTDNIYVQGGPTNREFSFIVCFYGNTSATFTGVSASGTTSTIPVSGVDGTFAIFAVPGGPATPNPAVTPVC